MITKGTKLFLIENEERFIEETFTVGDFSIEITDSGEYDSFISGINQRGETIKYPTWMILSLLKDSRLCVEEHKNVAYRIKNIREAKQNHELANV